MYQDLTHMEIEHVQVLLDLGNTPDFITHAIVMGRDVSLTLEIRAAVDMIIEDRKKDEE